MIGWPPQSAFLTFREWLLVYLSFAGALVAVFLSFPIGLLAPVGALLLVAPRERRRMKSARQAGLVGFVQQASSHISAAEREEKLLRLAPGLTGWEPGERWLREFEQLLIARAEKS